MGIDSRELEAADVNTVSDAWSVATGKTMEDNILFAVNQQYAAVDSPVCDGDEVAFFPPVTGG
ncbi:MAG: MoaD/ThiS family protein [Gammaproteobacteria bacterium]|nr:MoaD/ThiS family protein [Gammaproteobacteria bacterium]